MSGSVVIDVPKWSEEGGVIYFSVTSFGMTGSEWIEHLKGKGFCLSGHAKRVLRSPTFKPTTGITTKVAIIKGVLFDDNDRYTERIRVESDKRKLIALNAEVACLIRDSFSDKEITVMGLIWIVAILETIKGSNVGDILLIADLYGVDSWSFAYFGKPDYLWHRVSGFAFAVSELVLDNKIF